MKNFNWEQFTRKIVINASMLELYNAWTVATEIEKWFLSKAKFIDKDGKDVQSAAPVTKGCTYYWEWFTYSEVESGKITEANGKDYLQFTFAGNCLVEVRLTKTEKGVLVALTQKNIPLDDASKQNIRLGCDTGWSFFLVNLKSVFEGGLDLRNKDVSIKGVVNS